jgi:glyoxylase-like metal-dependent hydrolase (beta-lactamase superfamily II)
MSGRYIIPLDLGDSTTDYGLSYLRRGTGQTIKGKNVAAYIGGAKKKIVVDTGPPDIERNRRYHPSIEPEERRSDQNMISQLAKAGVTPAEVDIVILTHLHWDHVGDVGRFPNAIFIVSHEELRFALDPPPCLYVAYEALQLGIQPLYLQVIERIRTVEFKEKEIVEGVRVIPLPGHTPGSMGVVVDTEKGPCVITGDAVSKYGNLEGAPEERQPYLMTGVYTDMLAMWRSFERIDEIVRKDYSRVIVGHDPLVFKKERYP